MASVLVLARLCAPSSELQIAESWYEKTALDDLLGVPAEKINNDRLYRTLDMLLPHKDDLCRHLQNRYGELFDASFDFLFYDITSTYFEGRAESNPLGQKRLQPGQPSRLSSGLHRHCGDEGRIAHRL